MFESAKKQTGISREATASLRLPAETERARLWQRSLEGFIERNSAFTPPEAMEAAAKLLAGRYSPELLASIESAAAQSPELAKIHAVVHRAREIGER